MSNKTKRAELLDDLLGPGTADQVADATKAAQDVLDAAGVQRKEAGVVERAAEAWRQTFVPRQKNLAYSEIIVLIEQYMDEGKSRAEAIDAIQIFGVTPEKAAAYVNDVYSSPRLSARLNEGNKEAKVTDKKSKGIFSSRDESRADALISAVDKWTGDLEALDAEWSAAVNSGADTGAIDRERRDLEAKIDAAERELQSIGYEEYTKEAKVDEKQKQGIVARIKARIAARRKAEGEEPKEGEGSPILEVLAAVGATEVSDAVKRIHEALSKAGVLEAVVKAVGSEEDLSNVLATAIAGGAKQEEAQQQAAAAPAAEVVTQPAAVKELKERLGQFAADTAADVGKIARSQLQLTEQQLDFEERLKQLEDRVGNAPRQASRDPMTLISDPILEQALKEQLGDVEVVAGIRVLKEAPNGNHR